MVSLFPLVFWSVPSYFACMGSVRYGTCSWKYPSWETLVYSSSNPPDYLAEYAQLYDMVEVDQWFWSLGKNSAGLPKEETVVQYDAATPQEFRFTIKCPNALTRPTHDKDSHGEKPKNAFYLEPDLMRSFIDSLQPIRKKIGLLMFQFGYLNKQIYTDQKQFMTDLEFFFDSIPSALPYAIELRNPKWLNGEWFSWLQRKKVTPVLIQGYWMDDVAKTIDRYESLIGDTISIRLHGEDRQEIEEETGGQWNRLVNPRDRELAHVAQSIKSLVKGGRLVYVQVNNHYEGSAPLTIERLRALI